MKLLVLRYGINQSLVGIILLCYIGDVLLNTYFNHFITHMLHEVIIITVNFLQESCTQRRELINYLQKIKMQK